MGEGTTENARQSSANSLSIYSPRKGGRGVEYQRHRKRERVNNTKRDNESGGGTEKNECLKQSRIIHIFFQSNHKMIINVSTNN